MKKFLMLLLLVPALSFCSMDFSFFDQFQGKFTKEEIDEKLGLYLQKDGGVGSYFNLTQGEFILFSAPETEKERAICYSLKLAPGKKRISVLKPSRKNLVGMKIALDPGHLGGPYARLEERYIDILPSLQRKEPIQFDEGTLSFLTASYLKLLLEKEGAIVMITRDQIGKGVYPEDFFDWLKKHPPLWSGEVSLNRLFGHYYNPLDLRARAEKINGFGPDLTLVIHYNCQDVEGKTSNHHVATQNYNLVFVPGAFCRKELEKEENRFEFLRLLLTEDVKESIALSQNVVQRFTDHLQVPLITKNDKAHYLEHIALKISEGVYARNLALTRWIHGPVCYGETLIQNNIDECINLSRQDFVINGQRCSSRVKQVAEAYFEGVKQYALGI